MLAHAVTPILNVSNILESFAWFERLGWTRGFSWGSPPTFGAESTYCELNDPAVDESSGLALSCRVRSVVQDRKLIFFY